VSGVYPLPLSPEARQEAEELSRMAYDMAVALNEPTLIGGDALPARSCLTMSGAVPLLPRPSSPADRQAAAEEAEELYEAIKAADPLPEPLPVPPVTPA
jgi:hypothetical protein